MPHLPRAAMSITSSERLSVLRNVPPLESMSADALEVLAQVMRIMVVDEGARVVRQGADDRAMFVLAKGSAKVVRDGVVLGQLEAGQHFGEIALVVGGRRTASVIALEPCQLLALDEPALDTLMSERPRLAVELLRKIVTSTSSHLARMNETVSLLLQERALPRRVDLEVRLPDRTQIVRNGTTAGALLPRFVDGVPVVAALVDGRARSLASALVGSCELEPLTSAHWEGQRIYRKSLGLALLEASRRVGVHLKLGASLGFAQRLHHRNPNLRPADTAALLDTALHQLIDEDVQLTRERMGVLEAIDYFRREGADETVRLLETTRRRTVTLVAYGEVFAVETGPLLPTTGNLSGFEIVADGSQLLLVYGVPGHRRDLPPGLSPDERRLVAEGRPARHLARRVSQHVSTMTADQQRWLQTLDMHSVGHFNRACIDGSLISLLRVAEGFHEKRIGHIADAIAERRDEVRLITIAGPSSSGKTTFIRRLSVQLQVNGMTPVGLGLDDYYVDREMTPRAPDGEYDFESFDALHVPLLHEHLGRLVAGERVTTARFDFPTGISHPSGGPILQLRDADLLLMEGIHGLNPQLVDSLPSRRVFRIFVCPLVQLSVDRLSQVHPTDLRLLRRIVRDRHGRAISAAESIRRWPSVRRGERLHIFPYQHHADAVFDTSLVYEIPVLKVFAERFLLEVPSADAAQATAERLLDLLDSWVTIYPDHVPPNSILREFIGGRGFQI